jgi:hypothetical protein
MPRFMMSRPSRAIWSRYRASSAATHQREVILSRTEPAFVGFEEFSHRPISECRERCGHPHGVLPVREILRPDDDVVLVSADVVIVQIP